MFFERPDTGERVVLVHCDLAGGDNDGGDSGEFVELVEAAGADAVTLVNGRLASVNPKYFVGTGKLEDIRTAVIHSKAELVLFNHSLSPSQERNLERELCCRVLDRTGLILDIFAQRARSYEGKLQVELAQLHHMSTRLVRGWTHLERQKGGIGLRGPGETQLETDRRLLRGRIKSISRRLDKVHRQRQQGRRARKRAQLPTVALVGYTNAGKSTLFNAATQAQVFAADQLFATLDPTLRRLDLPGIGPIVLADTVGFIRHLPHKLVDAFHATLEEAAEADLLLHIVDASAPDTRGNIEAVETVLAEIGADEVPSIQVFNKVDLLADARPRLEQDAAGLPQRLWLSAQTGEGIELLGEAIARHLAEDMIRRWLPLTAQQGRLRAKLYACGAVLSESADDAGGMQVEVRMPRSDFDQLLRAENIDPASIVASRAP